MDGREHISIHIVFLRLAYIKNGLENTNDFSICKDTDSDEEEDHEPQARRARRPKKQAGKNQL